MSGLQFQGSISSYMTDKGKKEWLMAYIKPQSRKCVVKGFFPTFFSVDSLIPVNSNLTALTCLHSC